MEKLFPVFTAYSDRHGPCGHQHRALDKAIRCARNLARAHPGSPSRVSERYANGSYKPRWDSVQDVVR